MSDNFRNTLFLHNIGLLHCQPIFSEDPTLFKPPPLGFWPFENHNSLILFDLSKKQFLKIGFGKP